MSKCNACGTGLEDGDVFCSECGTNVQDELVQEDKSELCVNCGEVFLENSTFCAECGTAKSEGKQDTSNEKAHKEVTAPIVHTNEPKEESITPPISNQQKPKKAMSKWTKFLLITLLVGLMLIFGAYKFAEYYYDPMKELVKMDEAITNNEVDEFMDLIEFDQDIPLDKDTYFAYIQEEEWDNGVKESYYDLIEAEKVNPSPLQKELMSQYEVPLFKVKDKKILLGLFKGYTLQAIPVKVSATSNLDKTELKILDQTVKVEEAYEYDEIGYFYPGVYEIESMTVTDYGDFSIKEEYIIDANEYEEIEVNFNYGTFYIEMDYNEEFDDAILYVNGESTKKKVREMGEVGPIPLDAKVKIHAEWASSNDKMARSNTVQLDEGQDTYVFLEFDERIALEAEEVNEEDYDVAEFVLDFRTAYENAVNYAEYDEIATFMKSGSQEEKDLKKFIKDMGDATYYYDFEDNMITNVEKTDDKHFEVETNEQFVFYDEDGIIYEYDRDKIYFIELIDEAYKIHKIDYKDTNKKRVN